MFFLSGKVNGYAFAGNLTRIFLNAHFKVDEQFSRRIAKVTALEKEKE